MSNIGDEQKSSIIYNVKLFLQGRGGVKLSKNIV